MKSRTWMWITPACLFAALAIPVGSAAHRPFTNRKSKIMTPTWLFRFARALQISVAALLVCGLQSYGQQPQSYGQRQDLRTPRGAEARAAAAKMAATHADSIAQALTIPPPTAVGTFVTFDVPGAVNGTSPASINNGGDITGGYGDNIGSGSHGFIRTANGSFVTFDAPGGGFILGPSAINARGEVAGSYFDVNFIQHSFLRESNGALTTFDPPSAANGSFPSTITPDGVILGVYFDVNFNSLGFLRDRSGTFTEVNGPGGLTGQYDPYTLGFGAALSINPRGEIAGTYFEPIAGNPFGGIYRVFLLSKDGQYTTFDGANYPPCCIFSSPSGINPAGTVTGILNDGFSVYRGFLRTSDGTVTVFDAPGAGTGNVQGTVPIGITPGGLVAGVYVGPTDGNFFGFHHGHGFLFQPQ
jgi:hypothetical protein